MNRLRLVISAVLLALIVAISMFAPTPVTSTVEAQGPSCNGLQNAYAKCRSNDGNGNTCSAIREQLIAHGCYFGSSGGSGLPGSGSR